MNIFITGGTTGIGLELAKLYLRNGHHVGICGRDESKLPSNFLTDNNRCKFYQVDVVDRETLDKAINDFAKGKLDIIYVNAGIALSNKTALPDFERGRQVIATNVLGAMNTIEPALKIMLKQKSGSIVGISSLAASGGLPGTSAYCASKAALAKYLESLAIDMKKNGIYVTTVAPGWIATPLTSKNHHPMPFMMTAKDAAQTIAKVVDKKKVFYSFPLPLALLVRFLSFLPRGLYVWLFSTKLLNYSKK